MTAQGLTPSLLLLLVVVVAGAAGARWRGEGTTRHLESIIRGRCAEYIARLNPDQRDKNCTALWEAFRMVLLRKDPCSVFPSDYDLFINLSRHSIPRDKSLFWENNHLLVTSYTESGRRLMPLGNVLYGRFGDFLSWCRQENGSGLDYQSCPSSEDCENNAVDSFWRRASMQYSRDSSGVIHVMLNGSEPAGAYPIKGFFADFEIPYFQKDKITRIEIWVMHDIGRPKVESCGEGSVKILEDRLRKMGFQYSCINDHPPVKLLQCVDHSTHPDCALNSAAASAQRGVPPLWAEHGASHILLLLVALASLFKCNWKLCCVALTSPPSPSLPFAHSSFLFCAYQVIPLFHEASCWENYVLRGVFNDTGAQDFRDKKFILVLLNRLTLLH